MLAFLNQVRKPTLDLPLDVRRKMWFKPFMQSYLVVFIGYLTMYLRDAVNLKIDKYRPGAPF
ncbi:hypothetical protein, partial [Klebsiella pneumoniae]|uniref:hypothetical protein n=1 Tax=Klebsiella pneumoniae TaxID=573 RepID=UPI00165F61C0